MSTNSSSDMGPNSVDGDSHASTSRLSMKSGFHTAPKRAPKRTADNLYEIYLEKEIERVALSSKKLREEMSKIALEKELIALKIQKLKKEIDCPVKQEVFDLTSWPEM
ncbi:uncharacterized protein LOC121428036 [Lytechinus variegatus]|uniref:uncharacterized protein LOC121428036 n=1 Tax=Lytechinus variegatus TaxID=7654 RepID=UPI001BB1BE03|nr:uncharacterized protein LOC121428036 [Lytechinus variegatus]